MPRIIFAAQRFHFRRLPFCYFRHFRFRWLSLPMPADYFIDAPRRHCRFAFSFRLHRLATPPFFLTPPIIAFADTFHASRFVFISTLIFHAAFGCFHFRHFEPPLICCLLSLAIFAAVGR